MAMKISEYEKLPDSFKESVYKKYMDHNGNPEIALSFVNEFLNDYPLYPEALLFKARMLIALGRDKDALICLKTCEIFDRWRIACAYDKAEVLFRIGKKSEAIRLVRSEIETSLRNVLEGIENFLLGVDFDLEGMNVTRDMIKREIALYLSNKKKSLDFKNVNQMLRNHQVLSKKGKSRKQKADVHPGG
jgi:tetratricopeptide (TPR) repeat protein